MVFLELAWLLTVKAPNKFPWQCFRVASANEPY
jgi:hypothetical protein